MNTYNIKACNSIIPVPFISYRHWATLLLNWPPVSFRIDFKILVTSQAFHGLTPGSISELLIPYVWPLHLLIQHIYSSYYLHLPDNMLCFCHKLCFRLQKWGLNCRQTEDLRSSLLLKKILNSPKGRDRRMVDNNERPKVLNSKTGAETVKWCP